jgi:uracil-DNA glycosylase family 4
MVRLDMHGEARQMADKTAQLAEIAEQVQDLSDSPLYEYRKKHKYSVVLGEGDPDARILFVGEAPGLEEARSGRPFVGAAGRILDELLESIGLGRQQVYITNVVKDRPPDNRDPAPAEIETYAPFLWRQIQIIQPRVIVTLGRFAMDFVLQQFNLKEWGQKISRLHGQPLQARAAYGDVTIVPLYHPAVALYNPNAKETIQTDFQVLRPFV